MKVRIDITKGPDRGRNFVLEASEKRVIGRGENVEVRMIDELVSREHCEVEFDGKGFSSGIYFYRMTAGDYVETKKLLLLR